MRLANDHVLYTNSSICSPLKDSKATGVVLLLACTIGIAMVPLGSGEQPKVADAEPAGDGRITYSEAVPIAKLDSALVRECSGMATSRADGRFFWAHNDSGDGPRLYAFDFKGTFLASVKVEGARCLDWEDIAAFRWKNQPYLAIADMGDNSKRRDKCQLYLVPDNAFQNGQFADSINIERIVEFTYEDGPSDCESIAFDEKNNCFILVTKNWGPYCNVFRLPMPAADDSGLQKATKIGRLKLAGFTGFDISPDSKRAIGVTYADAYEFHRQPNESWKDAFARKPRQISLPARKQGESICYGADGKTIYTSSEGVAPPLIRVAPE